MCITAVFFLSGWGGGGASNIALRNVDHLFFCIICFTVKVVKSFVYFYHFRIMRGMCHRTTSSSVHVHVCLFIYLLMVMFI